MMAAPDNSSYYAGICVAIIAGYLLSLLRIERLFLAAILLLPERVGGRPAKNQIIAAEEKNAIEFQKALPATPITSGWTDENIFELERRAIFSKTWLFATHTSRFQKPGDYRTYEMASFSFIIILGKDKQLRAFHNVCRHRAYAVTKKECGSSTVLGCRYHGWSYDTRGNLIKAPEFENVPGFDKGKNGLWEVKTNIREGMVFVNLDARRDVESATLGESEDILRRWNMRTMKCITDWKVEAPVNWKFLASLGRIANLERPWWLGFLPLGLQRRDENLKISSTTIVKRLASGILVVLSVVPKSANSAVVDCSIFGSRAANSAEVEALKAQVSLEIDQLVANAQELRVQGSTSCFTLSAAQQAQINRLLEMHLNAERRVGAQIHPAARSQNFTLEGKADDDFCKELGGSGESICSANAKGLLDW